MFLFSQFKVGSIKSYLAHFASLVLSYLDNRFDNFLINDSKMNNPFCGKNMTS